MRNTTRFVQVSEKPAYGFSAACSRTKLVVGYDTQKSTILIRIVKPVDHRQLQSSGAPEAYRHFVAFDDNRNP